MNLRQQPIATAQVYVRRFYTKVEIRRTNPYTVMTTAVYLASKMEESPVHIRFVLGEAVRQWPGKSEIFKQHELYLDAAQNLGLTIYPKLVNASST